MNRRIFGWLSIALSLLCGIGGWISVGALDLGASDSLAEANRTLATVEQSLRNSTDVATATADALDGAALSIEAASDASASTSDVAVELAGVAGALPPVLESVAGGVNDVNEAVAEINGLLDDLPFSVGVEPFNPALSNIDPLLEDLRDAETSLLQLSGDADSVQGTSTELATDLRVVAIELRSSVGDIDELADGVAETRATLDAAGEGDPVNLLPAQLLIAGFALAIIAQAIPLVREPQS